MAPRHPAPGSSGGSLSTQVTAWTSGQWMRSLSARMRTWLTSRMISRSVDNSRCWLYQRVWYRKEWTLGRLLPGRWGSVPSGSWCLVNHLYHVTQAWQKTWWCSDPSGQEVKPWVSGLPVSSFWFYMHVSLWLGHAVWIKLSGSQYVRPLHLKGPDQTEWPCDLGIWGVQCWVYRQWPESLTGTPTCGPQGQKVTCHTASWEVCAGFLKYNSWTCLWWHGQVAYRVTRRWTVTMTSGLSSLRQCMQCTASPRMRRWCLPTKTMTR